MLTISTLPSVKGGQDRFRKIERIAINDEVVLTTGQLAEFYETDVKIISQNFLRNKVRFTEGKHYFKLEGETLKNFNCILQNEEHNSSISPMTRTLYLWTRKGVMRHCKMLSTDKAWSVFEKMEDTFFRFGESDYECMQKELQQTFSQIEQARINLRSVYVDLICKLGEIERARRLLQLGIDEKNIAKANVLKELAKVASSDSLRDELLRTAAKLLTEKNFETPAKA